MIIVHRSVRTEQSEVRRQRIGPGHQCFVKVEYLLVGDVRRSRRYESKAIVSNVACSNRHLLLVAMIYGRSWITSLLLYRMNRIII